MTLPYETLEEIVWESLLTKVDRGCFRSFPKPVPGGTSETFGRISRAVALAIYNEQQKRILKR